MIQPVVLVAHASCPKPAVAVAPREPYVTRGPTEVVVGLYVQGGALIPNCPQEPRGPDGGTVTVSAHGGRIVARETLRAAGLRHVFEEVMANGVARAYRHRHRP